MPPKSKPTVSRGEKKLQEKLNDPFKFMSDQVCGQVAQLRKNVNTLMFFENAPDSVNSRAGVINVNCTFPISNPTTEDGTITFDLYHDADADRKTFYKKSLVAPADFFDDTVSRLQAKAKESDDNGIDMDTYDNALCTVRQMEIMSNGKVHKRDSVAGKGGKGKVVSIATGEKYTYPQAIARQTIAFLDDCKSTDDDLRNAFFDAYFLQLSSNAECKLILPDTGTDEAKDIWKSIAGRFFGVAACIVEPLLDGDDGLPIPYYYHTTEGTDEKSSILLDSSLDQPMSSFTRTNIVQIHDAPEYEDEDAEEPEDKPVEAPPYKLGFTVTFINDDTERPAAFPKSYEDIDHPLDMRKFIACPPWMLNRLRSLSEQLLGEIPPIIDKADAAEHKMNFVDVANEFYPRQFGTMYELGDDERKKARHKISNAPWRSPIVTKNVVDSDKTFREIVRYYSLEEKSLVDTYFVFPNFHDADEHCKESYKRYRREVNTLLKPLIADSINFKIRGKLVLAESAPKPKPSRKRKAAADGGAGSSGGSSAALIDPDALREMFKSCFKKESEPLQKQLKLLLDHFEIPMEVDAADAADAADVSDSE